MTDDVKWMFFQILKNLDVEHGKSRVEVNDFCDYFDKTYPDSDLDPCDVFEESRDDVLSASLVTRNGFVNMFDVSSLWRNDFGEPLASDFKLGGTFLEMLKGVLDVKKG